MSIAPAATCGFNWQAESSFRLPKPSFFHSLGEIDTVSSDSGPLTDGGADNQGMDRAGTPKVDIYMISNTGPVALTLSGAPTATNLRNVQDVTLRRPAL